MQKKIKYIAMVMLLGVLTAGCSQKENTNEKEESILDLFPNPHDLPEKMKQEYDLDQDGKMETVSLTDLGYCGGDGGCRVEVTRKENGIEKIISMPDDYNDECGFPYTVKWDGSQMEIGIGDEKLKVISKKTLEKIYEEKELLDCFKQSYNTPEEGWTDAVSGFTIREEEGERPVLILKSYLSGLCAHMDCIGYGIAKLELNPDDTWQVTYDFLYDE